MPILCIQATRGTVPGECPMDKLVKNICLCFSPDTTDPQGAQQMHEEQHDAHPCGTTMGQTDAVFSDNGDGAGASPQVLKKKRPTLHGKRRNPTPRAREPQPLSLAPEDLEFAHLKLPENTLRVLREARRPSTRKCYGEKWKRFTQWCCKKPLQRRLTKESTVLRYLTHLIKAKLSSSSLRVHLAAIVAYTRGETGRSFFTSQVVKRFLEGAKRIAPPKRMPPPAWNLVLTELMKAPFEPIHKASLQMLTMKTAFLVAITSLRRVSELQALTLQEPYIQIHSDRVVMRTDPHFMPKVVSRFHMNQSIQIPSFFQNPTTSAERSLHTLDARRAVLHYIERTKDHRKTKQFFVSFTNRYMGKPVTKNTIARWIAQTIQFCHKQAGQELTGGARAHSTRKKGATIAFLANTPIQDICLAATWASVHTFTKHYCVDVQMNKEAQVGQKVLQHIFSNQRSSSTQPPQK
ncbi:uncharacterized protein LOC144791469 [Lissotriton helveticus]